MITRKKRTYTKKKKIKTGGLYGSCIYHQIFSKYGMPEMTAVFCKVDDILYSELPKAEFLYTEQIGRGGSMCDYTFKER